MQCTGFVSLIFSSLFVTLRGEFSAQDEETLGLNYTTLWELLKFQTNPYLQDLQGHWSFNDTIDISKYEEFDHTRFQGSPELSMDELVQKVKQLQRSNKRRPDPPRTTQPPEELLVFDTSMTTNVTAQLGGTAFLHCRVRNLKNRAISWVRKRDWHILTSAMFTYTNDERFQVLHNEGSEEWILQIKYVQNRDSGAYECQVASSRGTQSQLYNLEVVVPTADIIGTGEIHIGHGSDLTLVCVIENSPSPPQFVMWYHNDNMINYEEEETQMRVMTESGGEKTHSRLVISRASSKHSGNYSCRASNTRPDSVYVFVSNDGDNIAAIQRQDASDIMKPCFVLMILTTLRFLLS
ncbi:zwei Ig domain protein zig-8 [Halyomorpha halys]|uniref:zwei Ig domain protein zig-8 n=1 Tax=Halyomorpha halys TaxID=286706 RepID=UPI0006D5228D